MIINIKVNKMDGPIPRLLRIFPMDWSKKKMLLADMDHPEQFYSYCIFLAAKAYLYYR
jgi:hypothetical protein